MLKLTVQEALTTLAGEPKTFIRLFRHGSLEVEIYRPEKVDLQGPHTRDELYVVATGSGQFSRGDERTAVAPGDVLFVPAHTPHKFFDFTDDFSTWVFFYGPEGGEAP
jgi:mannose-6-phosphate isomerase-like protein (cupin superfamily)